jgi:hypothetical protein
MGPYCTYCNTQCFVPFPDGTPQEAIDAYQSATRHAVTIIATCSTGQAVELQKTGWNYQGIKAFVSRQKMQVAKEE